MQHLTDKQFVDFLFGKLLTETDTEMIDLHDDDAAGIDAIEFEKLHESEETN